MLFYQAAAVSVFSPENRKNVSKCTFQLVCCSLVPPQTYCSVHSHFWPKLLVFLGFFANPQVVVFFPPSPQDANWAVKLLCDNEKILRAGNGGCITNWLMNHLCCNASLVVKPVGTEKIFSGNGSCSCLIRSFAYCRLPLQPDIPQWEHCLLRRVTGDGKYYNNKPYNQNIFTKQVTFLLFSFLI